ncbi:MAG: hypothetical protein Fur0041_09240 [Bacteroidia bacterium]
MSNEFQEKTHETEQHKVNCKDCGALLEYNPGTMNLTCQYCGAQNEIQEDIKPVATVENDFHAFLAGAESKADTMDVATVKCDNCGASTTLRPNVTADTCPFCSTALIIKGGTTSHIVKPKYLLPFSIDKKKGVEEFKKWLKGLWFAPGDLKHFAENDKLKGLYIPYWTYDSNTISHYTGMRGDAYYVSESYTTTVNGKTETRTRQVRKIRWTPVSGTVYENFDDVLVMASHSLPDEYANKLEPWDLGNLTDFKEQFLSGFVAEKYQIDVKEGFEKAKVRMDDEIRSSCRRDIGGDEQQVLSVSTQYNDITFKHILLPIWLSAYKYKDKVYRFMINGRTGEVQGERPYSAWKIFFFVLSILAVIGGGIYLYMQNKK